MTKRLPTTLCALLLLFAAPPMVAAPASTPQPAPGSTVPWPAFDAAFLAFDVERAGALLNDIERVTGPTVDTLYYRTRIAVLRNDPTGAKRSADACVARHPNVSRCHEALAEANIAAVFASGSALASLDRARAAKAAWAKAFQLDPRNARAGLLLLRYCRQAPWVAGGSEREARDLETKLARVSPAAGHQARALNLLADERYDQAISAFNAAVAADPSDRDPRIYLLMTYSAAKRWADAARYGENLLQRYPKFWDGWLMLANAHHEGRLAAPRGITAARTFLANAGQRAPQQRAQAQAILGALLERTGDVTGARSAIAVALRLDEDNKLAVESKKRLGENCC